MERHQQGAKSDSVLHKHRLYWSHRWPMCTDFRAPVHLTHTHTHRGLVYQVLKQYMKLDLLWCVIMNSDLYARLFQGFRSEECIMMGFLCREEAVLVWDYCFLRAAGHVSALRCSLKYSLGVICCLLFLKKTVEEAKSIGKSVSLTFEKGLMGI